MLDFKAKMHQIQFRLKLRPRPLEELTALRHTHTWIKGGLLLRGGGRVGEREVKEREGREVGEGKGGERRDRAPKLLLNHGPSEPCYATFSVLLFFFSYPQVRQSGQHFLAKV